MGTTINHGDPAAAIGLPDGVGPELLARLYLDIVRIRAAELRLRRHIDEVGFGGFWHPGIGQEGLQAGAVAAMRTDDYLFYAHRGLGYPLAKGMSLVAIFGDLLGRVNGSTRGKGGGTAHFADPSVGVMGQGGTLGSNFVLGAGTAVSTQLLGQDRVTVIFFGDGASSRGTFHEAALQASVWKLPVVWICENNGWALSARFEDHSPTADIAARAPAYGVPGVIVDGQNPLAVFDATREAISRARDGGGPTLIEAKTLRIRGHFEGDRQKYRDDLTDPDVIPNDPVELMRGLLPSDESARLDELAIRAVNDAFDEALAGARPDPSVIFEDVWA